jgi:uncharacterized membrane protein HdeD (DUF308 family)
LRPRTCKASAVDDLDLAHGFREAGRFWWMFLVIGVAWILFAIVVFRFDWRTVSAISILFGIVLIFAAIDELFSVFAGDKRAWARIGHAVLAVLFGVIAIVAFVHPGNTFAALAAVISFYFVFKGILEVGLAIADRRVNDTWWVQLLVGIAEILIGFWAAGDFGHKSVLLVVWVGVLALTRGISAITFAFVAREFRSVEPNEAV